MRNSVLCVMYMYDSTHVCVVDKIGEYYYTDMFTWRVWHYFVQSVYCVLAKLFFFSSFLFPSCRIEKASRSAKPCRHG